MNELDKKTPEPRLIHPGYIALNIQAVDSMLNESTDEVDKIYYKGMKDAWFILLNELYPEAFDNEEDNKETQK